MKRRHEMATNEAVIFWIPMSPDFANILGDMDFEKIHVLIFFWISRFPDPGPKMVHFAERKLYLSAAKKWLHFSCKHMGTFFLRKYWYIFEGLLDHHHRVGAHPQGAQRPARHLTSCELNG